MRGRSKIKRSENTFCFQRVCACTRVANGSKGYTMSWCRLALVLKLQKTWSNISAKFVFHKWGKKKTELCPIHVFLPSLKIGLLFDYFESNLVYETKHKSRSKHLYFILTSVINLYTVEFSFPPWQRELLWDPHCNVSLTNASFSISFPSMQLPSGV